MATRRGLLRSLPTALLLAAGLAVLWPGSASARDLTPNGDVDCSESVNVVDAVLVLQLHAGLVPTLQCEHLGDVTADGAADSLDAVIILQSEAGLIEPLPALIRLIGIPFISKIEGCILLETDKGAVPLLASVDVIPFGQQVEVTGYWHSVELGWCPNPILRVVTITKQ